MTTTKRLSILLSAAALAFATPAMAQKSKDTIRLAIQEGFSTVDLYLAPGNEAGRWVRDIFGRLTVYNENTRTMQGELAKAWRHIDDRTLELDLRDDIYFTSGNKFTAEDVKYTLDWLKDPALKIRFKARYTWIDKVEVLSPTKVRIHSFQPRADALELLAYRILMYDKAVHSALADKADYGRTAASSTGPYKLVSIDRTGNVVIERNDDSIKKFPHMRAPIKTVVGVPIPDRQTQIAELMTGGVDVLGKATPDMLEQFASNPDFKETPFPTRMLVYITLDAAGRSDNKVMTDVRVRQAFFKAIDREGIIKHFVPGPDIAIRPNAICFDDNIACSPTTKPVAYDPAGARKLLAEAGYPDGFDLEFAAFAPYKDIAEAIAGDLRKVGIRASINSMPLSVYPKQRSDGKLTALIAEYPAFAQPNTVNIMDMFFGADRSYNTDPIVTKAYDDGPQVLDLKKRTEIYRTAINRVNEMSYIYPFTELPNILIHSKNVEIKLGKTSITETRPSDYFWK